MTPHDFQPSRSRWGSVDPAECAICQRPWDALIHHVSEWVRRAAEHRLPAKVAWR